MKHILRLFLALFLLGCDSRTEWRDGNYEIRWIDTPELSLNLNIGEGAFVERVPADVIAVGSNTAYIVVKHRNPKSKVITYFYLEKNKDGIYKNASDVVQGPYSEVEFKELTNKIVLPMFKREFNY